MKLFWTFFGVPVWPKFSFIWARNLDEYFTEFISSKILNFVLVSYFYSIASQNFKMKKIFVKI